MKTLAKILTVTLLIVLVFSVTQSHAQNQNTGRYIVTLRGPIGNTVQRAGGQVIHQYSIIPAIAIEVPNAALAGLARNPNVIKIESDTIMWAITNTTKTHPGLAKKPPSNDTPEEPPVQPEEFIPWGVDRIDAEEVWGDYTGYGINVAVIDTGIDNTHPDLAANYKGGINIINTRKTPMDDNGHGTHVAGTIAAIDNEIGVIGVAPQASLYAVKVLNRSGYGFMSDIIAGINWCTNTYKDKTIGNEIDIINMSLGGTGSDALGSACNAALQAGIIVVAAAGNEGASVPSAPAIYDSVISVGATYQNNGIDYIASFSNRGFDIAAPGVNIESTLPGGLYAYDWSGTSMACPHVVGTLALCLNKDSSIKPKTIAGLKLLVSALQTSADGFYNVIDAEEAVLGTTLGNN